MNPGVALTFSLAIAMSLAALAAEPANVDTTGLMALLHFDEAKPPLKDRSEEDFTVAVSAAQLGRPGVIGKACAFNGEDSYVRLDGTMCFPQQTIMVWVRPSAAKAEGGILSSQTEPGRSSWRWRLSRNTDKTVSFHHYDNAMRPEPDRVAASKTALPDDAWSHVAVTIDTTAGEQRLFVNGKHEATATLKTHSPFGFLFVGTSTTEEFFAGDVDEVAVFERVLSAEEIARHVASKQPFPDAAAFVSDKFVLKPVGDKAWFTFRHKRFGRRRWMLRMPEHMYRDEETKRSHVPYGVRWQSSPDRARLKFWCGLSDEQKRELCLDFNGEVVARDDAIDFTLTVTNAGAAVWRAQRMTLFCMQSGGAEGFLDYEAKRTFVRRGGKWITMNEVVEGKFADHRMCGVGVGKGATQSSRVAARVSEDGKLVLGIATDNATSLSFNFQNRIACMHSNPRWGPLKPGQSATATGKVYLFEGTLDDLWQRYRADFED